MCILKGKGRAEQKLVSLCQPWNEEFCDLQLLSWGRGGEW